MTHNGNEPYARSEIANPDPPSLRTRRDELLARALLAVSGVIALVVFGWLWTLIP